jgi:hypothetical protein
LKANVGGKRRMLTKCNQELRKENKSLLEENENWKNIRKYY